MKTHIKHFAILFCLLGVPAQLYSQGYIVPNGVINLGLVGSGYQIAVMQNPTNSDYTGFSLDIQSLSTFLFDPVVDEGVRTFLVSSNDSISLQPILSHSYTELTYPNVYFFAVGVPFYLGFYTGYNPQGGVYSNPVFGWGKFVNNAGAIQMLDSALEIEGGGIFAGTQTIIPVPEPSTFALATLGGLLLAWQYSLKKGAILVGVSMKLCKSLIFRR
jgi:hypothetical protein